MEELVADRVGERRAEHRDRRGEDHPRLVAVAGLADRLEQLARAVEIDAVALLEIGLGFARDDRGEMEDHVRPLGDQLVGRARRRSRATTSRRQSRPRRRLRRDDVMQGQLVDSACRARRP